MSRGGKFNWLGWIVLAALLLAWEYGGRAKPELQFYIPPISHIMAALARLLGSAEFAQHWLSTVSRFLQGYVIAALCAVVMGIVLGYFRFAYHLLEPLIEFLRPMPSVAIVPVAILALGLGDPMIIAVTIYASLWPILVNTIDGVRHIEPTLIATARSFRLSRAMILARVILPAASPQIMTGLRISLSIALILVTTAEMIAGSRGLGFFILDQERSFKSDNMYAGIIVVALLGYALNRLFVVIEGIVLRWHRGMNARGSV
jgi:ABC-type nitrate/sulfonate/bicarbonate transport system permease component